MLLLSKQMVEVNTHKLSRSFHKKQVLEKETVPIFTRSSSPTSVSRTPKSCWMLKLHFSARVMMSCIWQRSTLQSASNASPKKSDRKNQTHKKHQTHNLPHQIREVSKHLTFRKYFVCKMLVVHSCIVTVREIMMIKHTLPFYILLVRPFWS